MNKYLCIVVSGFLGLAQASAEEAADHVSQYGITWTFDKAYPVGQFCTGDCWVVGPVRVIGIKTDLHAPGFTPKPGQDGSMVNPGTDSKQGYDNRLPSYDAARNPAPACNDLWVLPNGNLLFVTGHGVKEVTRDKKVVFDYQSKSEIYACQRLSNGNTFIGECNAGRLLEVDPSCKIVKQVRLLPEGKDGGHLYMRNARRLSNGNYLVSHYGQQVVKEYDAEGIPGDVTKGEIVH